MSKKKHDKDETFKIPSRNLNEIENPIQYNNDFPISLNYSNKNLSHKESYSLVSRNIGEIGNNTSSKESYPLVSRNIGEIGNNTSSKESYPLVSRNIGEIGSIEPSKESYPLQSKNIGSITSSKESYPLQSRNIGNNISSKESYPLQSKNISNNTSFKESAPLVSRNIRSITSSKESYPLQSKNIGEIGSIEPSKEPYPLQSRNIGSIEPSKESYPLVSQNIEKIDKTNNGEVSRIVGRNSETASKDQTPKESYLLQSRNNIGEIGRNSETASKDQTPKESYLLQSRNNIGEIGRNIEVVSKESYLLQSRNNIGEINEAPPKKQTSKESYPLQSRNNIGEINEALPKNQTSKESYLLQSRNNIGEINEALPKNQTSKESYPLQSIKIGEINEALPKNQTFKESYPLQSRNNIGEIGKTNEVISRNVSETSRNSEIVSKEHLQNNRNSYPLKLKSIEEVSKNNAINSKNTNETYKSQYSLEDKNLVYQKEEPSTKNLNNTEKEIKKIKKNSIKKIEPNEDFSKNMQSEPTSKSVKIKNDEIFVKPYINHDIKAKSYLPELKINTGGGSTVSSNKGLDTRRGDNTGSSISSSVYSNNSYNTSSNTSSNTETNIEASTEREFNTKYNTEKGSNIPSNTRDSSTSFNKGINASSKISPNKQNEKQNISPNKQNEKQKISPNKQNEKQNSFPYNDINNIQHFLYEPESPSYKHENLLPEIKFPDFKKEEEEKEIIKSSEPPIEHLILGLSVTTFIIIIVCIFIVIVLIIVLLWIYLPSSPNNISDTILPISSIPTIPSELIDIGSLPLPYINSSLGKGPIKNAEALFPNSGSGLKINTADLCIGDNLKWNTSTNKCVCNFPFFGPYCLNEFHDPSYNNLGYIPTLGNNTQDTQQIIITSNSSGYQISSQNSIGITQQNSVTGVNQNSNLSLSNNTLISTEQQLIGNNNSIYSNNKTGSQNTSLQNTSLQNTSLQNNNLLNTSVQIINGKLQNPTPLDIINYNSIPVDQATSLTFTTQNTLDPTSCTSLCNRDPTCRGVLYNIVDSQYQCNFLTSDITISGITPSTINLEENQGFYINRTRSHPIFTDQVFVYAGKKPPSYWISRDNIINNTTSNNISNINTNSSGLGIIVKGVVNTLPWTPSRIVNDTKLTGIWSTTPFTVNDFNNLKTLGNAYNVFIDKGNPDPIYYTVGDYPLNLPDSFYSAANVYVMYT